MRDPMVDAIRAGDLALVRRLLADGVNPRVGAGGEPPLHVAARRGPLALVETLIAGGALVWQTDSEGRTALESARRGRSPERAAIIALLDRSHVADPSFRAAVVAIAAGEVTTLERLLDERPQLLRERNVGPEVYRLAPRHDYFRDPKLFWYVAGNPTIAQRMATNITEVGTAMLARGVESADLDYTLELVMTSAAAREQGHQRALIQLIIRAGATVTDAAVLVAAAYHEIDALYDVIALGYEANAPVAAALGDDALLARRLARADRDDVQAAFGLAIVNGHARAAALALDAGANVDGWLPVHTHSTALHQAAADDRADLIAFLLARGARAEIRDTLWDATPLQWAMNGGNARARAEFEKIR